MTTEAIPATATAEGKQARAIQIIGVGGAGLAMVETLARSGFQEGGVAGTHTDARRLRQSDVPRQCLLGAELTRGLGAGGDPDLGRVAAEQASASLRELCAGSDCVIVIAGLGKGTGSGAAPVVARTAREGGALVLALVILPFEFEGPRRAQQAQVALRQLKTAADAVICLPNQKVDRLVEGNATLLDTFKLTNELLATAVRGLCALLTRNGLIDVGFADLCQVVRGRQAESAFATAEAAGEHRGRELVERLLAHPFLDQGPTLAESAAVLVSLVGGPDLTFKEAQWVLDQIKRACKGADIAVGARVEPGFSQRIGATLVATRRGRPEAEAASPRPPAQPELEPPTADFPPSALELDTQHLSRPAAERPASRFAAPPPPLTPEKVEELLIKQGASPRQRRKAARLRQGLLPLEIVSKGRFAKSEPTVHRGADLDTPTYIRKGVPLN